MASRSDLSLETVREFILINGGKVTNHDLVKHFKGLLTNPESRVEARNEFKSIVNTVATIVRSDEGEVYLVLKKRYRNPELPGPNLSTANTSPSTSDFGSVVGAYPRRSSSSSTLSNFSVSQESFEQFFTPTNRQPPPYRPPPPPVSPSASISFEQHNLPHRASASSLTSHPSTPLPLSLSGSSSYSDLVSPTTSIVDYPRSPSSSSSADPPPPVPPRRKSSEKIKMDNNKENIQGIVMEINRRPTTIGADSSNEEINVEEDSKISVKECMQKFNRLASETALQKAQMTSPNKKKTGKETPDRDEEDAVSLHSLGAKGKEWLTRAAQSDYQALAKMSTENNILTRLKCPFTGYTALHWAAKHGNEDTVKLLAGTHKVDVNSRTNGGYTPLHIAMQFGHQDIYNLLQQVYGADSNLRDWSGRKARQYLTNEDTTVSADTFRKIKARKKLAEKDLGFLRIGSLNVRVKRTTEAFSNFLGYGHTVDKLHKSWGSADNIPLDDNHRMPPPKFAPIKKRKSRRAHDFTRPVSQQSLNLDSIHFSDPPMESVSTHTNVGGDSDSDTAAGFGSNWQATTV